MIDQQTTKSVVLMIAATLLMGSASAKADFAFSHNGSEYQVITSAKPWDSAVADARTKLVDGASCYLARIDDSAENNAIFSQLSSNIPASDFSSTVAPDGGGPDAAAVPMFGLGETIYLAREIGSGKITVLNSGKGMLLGGQLEGYTTIGETNLTILVARKMLLA